MPDDATSAVLPALTFSTEPQDDNLSADAYQKPKRQPKPPHFYRIQPDGSYTLVQWLADRLAGTESGRTQRIFADTLFVHGKHSRADAAASCGESWFPYRECADRNEQGKKHMALLMQSSCGLPLCPKCGVPSERLERFLYHDKGRVIQATKDLVLATEAHELQPLMARIDLFVPLHRTPEENLCDSQKEMQSLVDRWRNRLLRLGVIKPGLFGMVNSDFPETSAAGMRIYYIGPEIPQETLRDAWKHVAGPSAKLKHSRRLVSSDDIRKSEDDFDGMIESELQYILTLPSWMCRLSPQARGHVQLELFSHHMTSKVGYFYAYKLGEPEPQDHEYQEVVPESDLYAQLELPSELDLGALCRTCHKPLTNPTSRESGLLHDFKDTYDFVMLSRREHRALHIHNSITMCNGDISVRRANGMYPPRYGPN